MTALDDLAPCPFCGDRLVIVNGGDSNPKLARHPMDPLDGVHCPISWISLPPHRFEMWNRRSPLLSSPRVEEVRRMREALEPLVKAWDAYQEKASSARSEGQADAYYMLAKYLWTDWEKAKAALSPPVG